MKKEIDVFDYAETISKAVKGRGVFLNTMTDHFNSMVIGWGHLGTIWGRKTFTVYVRQSRHTHTQLENSDAFTISVPLTSEKYPEIFRVCGSLSGRDVNKADYVQLEEPLTNNVPGIREFPLTIECKVLYAQDQDLAKIPADVIERYYSGDEDEGNFHTAYIGEITAAYIIED